RVGQRQARRLHPDHRQPHLHADFCFGVGGKRSCLTHHAYRLDEVVMKRHCYWRDENGASSAEFAIVLLPFTALIFAIIYGSLRYYANQTWQYATEAAARCYSVDAGNCSTTGAVQTYARNHYKGPN